MEAVLRRTALAKSQAKRKARILESKELIRDRIQYRQKLAQIHREDKLALHNARIARREDWELGPLAPWRSAARSAAAKTVTEQKGRPGEGGQGEVAEREDFYGTFSARRATPNPLPVQDRIKDWFIREGDRCVVMEGREGVKGRIGYVKEVDKDTNAVKLEGINMVSSRAPMALDGRAVPARR